MSDALSEKKDRQFFQGFAWALPEVFADPLNACRFELGDTLYENKEAYHSANGVKPGGRAIQILEPGRGMVGKASDSGFVDAWTQEVVFDLYDLKNNSSERQTSTQGRLYSFLWHGDEKILGLDSSPPKLPLQANGLKKVLSEVVPFFKTDLFDDSSLVRFLTPSDAASGVYRDKFLKIKARLEEDFETTVQVVPANDLGLQGQYLPTVQAACFEMKNTTEEKVEKSLRKVLYKPSSNRKTQADRFSLTRHGLLI